MKTMLKKIWEWFKNLFSKDENQSEILKVIVNNTSSDEIQAIQDQELGRKAIEFVKELNDRTDITNEEKAKIFNEKLAEYALKAGKVLATHIINLLRELAVTAVRIAATAAITTLLTATEEVQKK